MITGRKSTRFYERTKLNIPLLVNYYETTEFEWTEETLTEEITICGGGFTLSRPVEPQRLIRLKLPMPKNFRLFGYDKHFYEVWGIIRYIKLNEPLEINRISLRVGTALIGNQPPPSFLKDPSTKYDLKPVLKRESLWDFREIPRNIGRYARSLEERRNIAAEVTLEIIDEHGQIAEKIETHTQNISESGMAVITKANIKLPRYVLIKSKNKIISQLAIVRGFQPLENVESMRLHLEFISGKWIIQDN